ncbi:MAG: carboxypeptidase regulatory-like domain-containing protein, partial [Thiothrix sp.]|nr:carboxypeptidase regulatory-like domain-containing protein [Thiothrix sp.]
LYQSSVNSYRKLNPATASYDVIGNLGSETSIGYNVLDNIIYGVRKTGTSEGQIIAIASDGSYASLGFATRMDTGAPLTLSNAQLAIDGENNIWMGNWRINLNTMTATPVVFSGAAMTTPWDWSYLPGAGGSKGKLYGVHDNKLLTVNIDTASITGTGTGTQVNVTRTVTNIAGLGASSGGYGAAWTDLNHDLYVYHNADGRVYQILNQDSASPTAQLVANTSPLGNNDGASCPLAPAPFYDYGDAPAPYATLIGDNGPAHAYLSSLKLGTYLNKELNGYRDGVDDNGNATDDDSDDGVILYGTSLQGQTLTGGVPVTLQVTTTGAATLYGFIDWNGDGDFGDAGETLAPLSASGGVQNLTITPPIDIITGVSYARFRYSTDPAAAAPTGLVLNGEVEDYQIHLVTGGVSVSGRAYRDTNVDGVSAATEPGIPEVTIVLYNTGTGTCRSTRTGADGSYRFDDVPTGTYRLYEAARETVPVPQTCDPAAAADPGGYHSTTMNALPPFSAGSTTITGRDFGDIQAPQFNLDNEKTTTPNQIVVHPHTFSSPADGQVSFNMVALYPDPASLNWNTQIYRDSNCDAVLDGGDVLHAAAIPLTAGDQVCLLVKVLTPGTATSGAMLTSVIESEFMYGDGSLGLPHALQQHTDITRIIAGPGTGTTPGTGIGVLDLHKAVWNVTRDIDGNVALPGETLRYTITYTNVGDGSVDELVIHDSIPAFTRLVPASLDCGDHPVALPPC